MQAVGYNAVEVDDWEASGTAEQPGGGSSSSVVRHMGSHEGMGRLETLLLEKNKRMEHELTQAKVIFLLCHK